MKKAIIGSLILSIFHSILFYGQDLGISVFLFTLASVILSITFLKRNDKIKNKKAICLSIPILLLSSTYFIFNNTFFNAINTIIIPILFAYMIIWACIDTFKLRELIGKSVNLIIGSLEFIPNAFKLIKDAFKVKNKEDGKKAGKFKLIIIGIVCSLPLLFIILGLLMTADGVFATIFENVFEKIMFIFTSEFIVNLIFRIILIVMLLVYLVCVIYNILFKDSVFNKEYKSNRVSKIHIDNTIINTILTILNIVYFIFTAVQLIYLYSYIFTDTTLSESLNLAKYARQGFFELMFITAINFVIIILSNENNKKQENAKNTYTKWMNVLMCVFTLVIAISAFMRMHLYESEFGYTFLRLMAYIILVTEIISILPTIYYIIKGKISLLKSYLVIGITMYVIFNFINIDYIIAKNNISRVQESSDYTREIDIDYLVDNLGTDAVSEIVELYKMIENKTDKRKINNYLYDIYEDVKKDRSLQEWNLSKDRAEKLLEPLNLSYQTYRSYNNDDYNL